MRGTVSSPALGCLISDHPLKIKCKIQAHLPYRVSLPRPAALPRPSGAAKALAVFHAPSQAAQRGDMPGFTQPRGPQRGGPGQAPGKPVLLSGAPESRLHPGHPGLTEPVGFQAAGGLVGDSEARFWAFLFSTKMPKLKPASRDPVTVCPHCRGGTATLSLPGPGRSTEGRNPACRDKESSGSEEGGKKITTQNPQVMRTPSLATSHKLSDAQPGSEQRAPSLPPLPQSCCRPPRPRVPNTLSVGRVPSRLLAHLAGAGARGRGIPAAVPGRSSSRNAAVLPSEPEGAGWEGERRRLGPSRDHGGVPSPPQ